MKHLSSHKNLEAFLLVSIGFLLYSVADGFMRYTLDYYTFAVCGFYTLLVYFSLILIFSRKFGGLKQITQTKKLNLLIIRGFFGTGCLVFFLYGLSHLTMSQTYTLLLTSPMWLALLAIPLLGEKIGIHRVIAIIVGFIGVLVVMRPGLENINMAAIGVLIGAISFALFIIITRKIGEQEPLLNLIFFAGIMDLVVFLIIMTAEGSWQLPQWEHMAFFAAAGLFLLLATQFASRGFSLGESSFLAPIHYSQIVWGTLIGYFFFAEIPEIWTIIGAVIIVASGIYLIHREHKAGQRLTGLEHGTIN